MGFLSDLLGGAEKKAAQQNRQLFNQYGVDANAALDKGYSTATGQLNNALGSYRTLADLAGQYRQGSDLFLDASGVNGAEGGARATGAFQTAPGYEFQRDQGLEALNRRAAITGMYASGNADIDTLKFSQGLADQSYNNWLSNLQGINQNALSATGAVAGGQAGVYNSLADLASMDAQNRVGVAGNVASGNVSANNLEAQGKSAGAKTLLGGILGGASLLTGGGLGSLGSNLGNAIGFNPVKNAAVGWKV